MLICLDSHGLKFSGRILWPHYMLWRVLCDVASCLKLGTDSVTDKNYDHRKVWIKEQLNRMAAKYKFCWMKNALCTEEPLF